MTSIFEYKDYRDLVRACGEERKSLQPEYTFAKLAQAMEIQAPYLSRVFRKEADLNSDQLFLACRHFDFNEEEAEFTSLLLEYARSTVGARKTKLREKIQQIQESQRHTKNHLKAEFLSLDESLKFHEYYFDPMAAVVHMCLMVPAYQSANSSLGRALNVPPHRLKSILASLQRLGLVRFDKKADRWIVVKSNLQLDQNSKLSQINHQLVRHASIEHIQRLPESEKYQFSVCFSADEETRALVRNEFNKFLKKIESAVKPAPSEIVCQMNFDLFKWDGNPT